MTDTAPFLQATIAPPAGPHVKLRPDGALEGFAQWCEAQPKGSERCWAAVARSLFGFATGKGVSQDAIASRVSNPPPGLKQPVAIKPVLDVLNLQPSGNLDMLRDGLHLLPHFIGADCAIAITIFWRGNGPGGFDLTAHIIAAFGWNTQRQWIAIFDPNTVGDTADLLQWVPYTHLASYKEGTGTGKTGTWGNLCYAVARNAR